MRKCDNDLGCPGHIEKFSHCVTEALWQDDPDKDTGSTEAYGYYGLYEFTESEVMNVDDEHTVMVPVGTYLLMSDEQGFVYDIEGAPEELHAIFAKAESDYDEWCEKNMEYV